MIGTVLRSGWLSLTRDRVGLLLTFALPLVFFSIFASVFGAMDAQGTRSIEVLAVVLDQHPASQALHGLLETAPGLVVDDTVAGTPADVDTARAAVMSGRVAAAIIIPRGFGAALEDGSGAVSAAGLTVAVLADRSNPLALAVVRGTVEASILTLAVRAMNPARATNLPDWVSVEDVLGTGEKRPSVAFFAAGIGVMFLLFALSGRSAILIEERELGVLRRMLAARGQLIDLLLGRWLFLTLLGSVQVTLMFLLAWAAFGLDLFRLRHLAGFAIMTPASAAAAAAFGLMLASACRTRAQLTGVASVVVLILSVLGGSLFPRFLMPEALERFGLWTFNAWALEGYQKVFWYEMPPSSLMPQVAVLCAAAVVFMAVSRFLAGRCNLT